MHRGTLAVTAITTLLGGAIACAGGSNRDADEGLTRLLEADRAAAEIARTAGRDVDRVLPIWTEDATILFSNGTARAAGRDQIRAFITRMRSNEGFEIGWEPDGGRVAASGELGFTYGTGMVTVPNADGELETMRTNYLLIWERQADGSWKVLIDR